MASSHEEGGGRGISRTNLVWKVEEGGMVFACGSKIFLVLDDDIIDNTT